jgi:arginyl-tRNA synthetase
MKDELPDDSYHGNEIIEIASRIKAEVIDKFVNVPYDENKINDRTASHFFKAYAKNYLFNIIKDTLNSFGVSMDIWFSESDIYKNNLINVSLQILKKYIYQNDGAT